MECCVYIPEREEAHTVFCASSSSGPSVLPNTNDQVLIPEGLPIREIIPPLSLPSAQHCFAFRSGYCDPGVGWWAGDSGMNGCRIDQTVLSTSALGHPIVMLPMQFLFCFFMSVKAYSSVISSHQADVAAVIHGLTTDRK